MRRFSPSPWLPILGATAAIAAGTAAPLRAQVLRSGDFVVMRPGSIREEIVRNRAGTETVIATVPRHVRSLRVAHDGDLLLTDDIALRRVSRIDGTVTTITSSLLNGYSGQEDIDGNYLVTDDDPQQYPWRELWRVTPSGQITLVPTYTAFANIWNFVVDEDGTYWAIAGDRLGQFARNGLILRLYFLPPALYSGDLAILANGDVAVTTGNGIARVDRATGQVTAIASGGNADALTSDDSGGLYARLSGNIVFIDAAGAQLSYPSWNTSGFALIPSLTGPDELTSGAGGVHAFAFELPGHAAVPCAFALAASVHPGLPLPGDARRLMLNPDLWFAATLGQDHAPLLTGFGSPMDAQGRATATIDLTTLPPHALAGAVFWLQAVTLAPGGRVGTVSNALRLECR